jgi:uncharacterized protein (TIGR03118 family)
MTMAVMGVMAQAAFVQTNLVSDLPGVAPTVDPNLQNPWGIAYSPSSPFWVSDNHTGVATLYNGAGAKIPLTVTIPTPLGSTAANSAPTGIVFNGASSFGAARFIFATEDGTIAAWGGGTAATLQVDNSGAGAVYKGLAIGNNGAGDFLYAANFSQGRVDVFNSTFGPASGFAFTDPNTPAGFAPFGIQNIAGTLYVTYARQNASKHDDTGVGGFVDAYNLNGQFLGRISGDPRLNSPWGLALAPATFAEFGGDLLVGNFGDGKINAINPVTHAFVGQLMDPFGNVIVNQGLWGLIFGNGGSGGNPNILYLTAGIPGPDKLEDHGLFAQIQAVPEPGTLGLLLIGGVLLASRAPRKRATPRR